MTANPREEPCRSCGVGSFENTGETTKSWPEGETRVGMKCDNCGVVTWMPEGVASHAE